MQQKYCSNWGLTEYQSAAVHNPALVSAECVTKSNRISDCFCNCINDGSGPAVHALQQECTNRPKVLCSKGKVLNVGVKRYRKVSGKCNGVECK